MAMALYQEYEGGKAPILLRAATYWSFVLYKLDIAPTYSDSNRWNGLAQRPGLPG